MGGKDNNDHITMNEIRQYMWSKCGKNCEECDDTRPEEVSRDE